ncbi:MAG: DUF1294 domain-containing protein [Phycisphaerales bacterium]|nr:DUF1294 domain-containing protein [Phycisphaerales bacterium]
MAWLVPIAILGIYGGVSVVTFFVYRADKLAAQRGEQRWSERSLHILALLGGWPGALIAQQVFRHKRRKRWFMMVTLFIMILHGNIVYNALLLAQV